MIPAASSGRFLLSVTIPLLAALTVLRLALEDGRTKVMRKSGPKAREEEEGKKPYEISR